MPNTFCKLGIIGWPLGYSLSPVMQEAALKSIGLEGEYKEYPVKFGELDSWLKKEAPKLAGFNVTMPYKSQLWDKVRKIGRLGNPQQDDIIGALNTVVVEEGRLIGYNTDGEGFLAPLTDRHLDLTGWRVILLGSGGAARAIAVALALKTKISQLTIWNRDPNLTRARHLMENVNRLRGANDFAHATDDIQGLGIQEAKLLINATPVGMEGKGDFVFAAEKLPPELVVYDLVYEPRKTELIQIAKRRGCPVITGDEMLAAQGAAAFELFVGQPGVGAKVYPVMKKALEEHVADRS